MGKTGADGMGIRGGREMVYRWYLMWGEKMELRILDAIQRLHNPSLDWFMCFITGGVFWLLVTVVLMVIPRTRRIGVTVFIGLPLCDGIVPDRSFCVCQR